MKFVIAAIALGMVLGPASPIRAQSNSASGAGAANALPISEVVLYSSGVGLFHRNGEVDGRATIELRFKTEDINDLLKSMVVQDFTGGKVTAVSYGSRDPITRTLRSFAVDLTDNPSLAELLNQVRGEAVEILRPGQVTGTILGVERKLEAAGEKQPVEVEYLNVLSPEGLQSIPLAQIHRIRLLNERLNAELNQALAVLATSHDTQKKSVAIGFDGAGRRKVGVAYIVQTPVWKTSYRLVFQEEGKPLLQGWAIVENTTDEDWNNVRLSLVSGRPISFTMDLYQPLYTTRPEVQPELYSSLRPQVYEDALEAKAAEPLARLQADAAFFQAPRAEPVARRSLALAGPAAATAEAAAVPESLAARSRGLQPGLVQTAEAGQTGELFEYTIQSPVSLTRQNSAMLPIIAQAIEGEKVAIYNQNVQAKHPLNGFKLKNTSTLHLMQGPITVFDDGAYAGDARIEDLAPGQERLISYALDLKTEVETQNQRSQQDLVTVALKKGTVITTRKLGEERTYVIKNRGTAPKKVLIEHPFRPDWTLLEPKEPAERSRDVYRFAQTVPEGETARVQVREERALQETAQLLGFANDRIAFYIRSQKVSAKVKTALQQIVALRDRIDRSTAQRAMRETRVNEITQEQSRIRENMARLSENSELFVRFVKKLDEQETELENLRKEIESLRVTESQQQQELNDFILNLDVE